MRVGSEKYIWGSDGRNELFDVDADPTESRNLVAAAPERAAKLEAELERLVEQYGSDEKPQIPEELEMDPATEANLRELGYIR